MEINAFKARPTGYTYFLELMGHAGMMPHWHSSFVSSSGTLINE